MIGEVLIIYCPLFGLVSKNCLGVVTSGFLVEVEKVNPEELRAKYPEAFRKEYDPNTGLLFSTWVLSAE